MKFKPGQSGNPNGRPPKSETAEDLRQMILKLLEGQKDQIARDLKVLKPKDRLNIVLRLFEFAVPKLQRRELVEDTQQKWNSPYLDALTDEELSIYGDLALKMQIARHKAEQRGETGF